MISRNRSTALFLVIAVVALLARGAGPSTAAAAQAAATGGVEMNCYTAKVTKSEASFGVHQWTVRQTVEWCVEALAARRRIASVRRIARVRVGTDWRVISRSGGVNRDGNRAIAESRFHLRLRRPGYVRNCYPRLALELWPSGRFERKARANC